MKTNDEGVGRGLMQTDKNKIIRIMIVDNEGGICDIYKDFLLNKGFEIEAFLDVGNAVK